MVKALVMVVVVVMMMMMIRKMEKDLHFYILIIKPSFLTGNGYYVI
jgi:hypothetical protein